MIWEGYMPSLIFFITSLKATTYLKRNNYNFKIYLVKGTTYTVEATINSSPIIIYQKKVSRSNKIIAQLITPPYHLVHWCEIYLIIYMVYFKSMAHYSSSALDTPYEWCLTYYK